MADERGPGDDGTVDTAGEAATDDRADDETGRQPETGAVEDGVTTCPECGESLPAGARFCPHCSTAIDESGSAVDLSDLDGDILPDDPSELLVEDETGLRRASGKIRALAGLAVSVPLAPLTLFLVGTVVSLSVWSAALVFLAGWLGPAAVLSRSRVPAEAFGRSLYLIAVGTLLIPVAIEGSGGDNWADTLAVSFGAVAAASFAIAAVMVVLGRFVTGEARKRVTGERRAFEDLRDE